MYYESQWETRMSDESEKHQRNDTIKLSKFINIIF